MRETDGANAETPVIIQKTNPVARERSMKGRTTGHVETHVTILINRHVARERYLTENKSVFTREPTHSTFFCPL
jgi:hypothetical protein